MKICNYVICNIFYNNYPIMDGWTDRQIDRYIEMDGWMDGWMDGQTDSWIE